MKHKAELMFSEKVSVDAKVVFLKAIKDFGNLTFVDMTSELDNELITAMLITDDGDRVRVQFYETNVIISVNLDFPRLIALHDFTRDYFVDTVIDLLITFGEDFSDNPYVEPPSA